MNLLKTIHCNEDIEDIMMHHHHHYE